MEVSALSPYSHACVRFCMHLKKVKNISSEIKYFDLKVKMKICEISLGLQEAINFNTCISNNDHYHLHRLPVQNSNSIMIQGDGILTFLSIRDVLNCRL